MTRVWILVSVMLVCVACEDDPSTDTGTDTDTSDLWDLHELADLPPDLDTAEADDEVDAAEADEVENLVDSDQDGVPDVADNCPAYANPFQEDLDDDGQGDLCDADRDGDLVPDDHDYAPDDPSFPSQVAADAVYAHSADTLYQISVKTTQVTPIGTFKFPAGSDDEQMTDLAIDQFGVIYGISFEALYVCSAADASCRRLASFPEGNDFNGLTWLPPGTLDPQEETLIAIANVGDWYRVDVHGTVALLTKLGSYGGDYSSAGDAYSIQGVGTFAVVNKGTQADNVVIRVDPTTGASQGEIATLRGFSGIWGLAGWTTRAFAFDWTGTIVTVDLNTGEVSPYSTVDDVSWWGAGVRTVIN